ncbi:MAG: type VI secretion system contractile sheath large subunit [Planctomycetes bacterium]|nr:type VI secretion system contractile sheath large subunit [Planctomycetota bacterium]
MRYQMNFGSLGKSITELKPTGTDRFRIALLGDFSGRANKGELAIGDALASRKPLKVDVDNIDDVIGRLNIEIDLPLGGDEGATRIEISSIDDFHPDELYDNLEIFEELAGLRQRLNNSGTFDGAASEVMSWLDDDSIRKPKKIKAKSRGTAIPSEGKLSDFARLVGRPTAENRDDPVVEELLKHVVGPYIVPEDDPRQEAMVAAVDEALSGLMRSILHHPDFQSLESLWRSVDLMTRNLETSSQLQIVLYDVTAEEIAADLSATEDLLETGLYRMLVEQPSMNAQQGPFAVILGCYLFEQTPPHAELLGRMAKIVSQSQTAFVSAIGTDCLKKQDPDDVHPLIIESWDTLRGMPEAAYLGLTVPRFMLRNPYGKKSDPIDPFEFEEFTLSNGIGGLLWGNSAAIVGLLLGQCFSQGGLKGMKLGSIMSVGDMPFHFYTDGDGDQIALPCTDRLLTMKLAEHVTTQHFMPMLSVQGRPEVRLGSYVSLNGGDLSGPWAPVATQKEAEATDSAPDEEDAVVEDELVEEIVETDSDEDDLDALLAGLSDDDSDDDDTADDDEEMDPELAALLADL